MGSDNYEITVTIRTPGHGEHSLSQVIPEAVIMHGGIYASDPGYNLRHAAESLAVTVAAQTLPRVKTHG